MKSIIKNISLILIVVFAIGLLVGCSPKEAAPVVEKPVVEDPVVEDPVVEDVKAREISPVSSVSLENLTLLDEYSFDFDNKGGEDKVSMYTDAQKDESGEIMWDDGQRWLFVVHGADKDYVLFDDYVQIGGIKSYIYTIDEDFYIASLTTGTANLTFKSYLYDNEKDVFLETIPFDTKGNVNMLHSSK